MINNWAQTWDHQSVRGLVVVSQQQCLTLNILQRTAQIKTPLKTPLTG